MTTLRFTVKVHHRTANLEIWEAEFDGRVIYRGVEPFFDVARIIQAMGYPDDSTIEMYHDGSSICALSGKLGDQAKLAVANPTDRGAPRIVRWVPFVRGEAKNEDKIDPEGLGSGDDAKSLQGGLRT